MAQDLVGMAEIAQMLEVSRQYAHRLSREDSTFPEPEAELISGRVWQRSVVEAWARTTGRIK